MSEVLEAEEKARKVIIDLPEKKSFKAFDVALQMGAQNRFNINTAESMIRRMNGTVRESDGRTWVFSPSGGVHGSWLKR